MKEIIFKQDDISHAAKELIEAAGDRRVVAFDAPMGAGKTTLIAEICRQLGAEDAVNSPTFSIVNDYGVAYHFDFYRLESSRQVADIGIYDYLDSGLWCLIEWPALAASFLPDNTVVVVMDVLDDGSRRMKIY